MTAAEHDVRVTTPSAVAALDAVTHPVDTQRTMIAQDIAASLAHELRNPVFAIASAARLLRYRIVDDPVMEKNIGRILRAAERLNGFVHALLASGLTAAGRL